MKKKNARINYDKLKVININKKFFNFILNFGRFILIIEWIFVNIC